ncbi:transposase [Streptomyces sp. NBC_01474]|nr:transposase [Streptomyces sp. NBC_01474]WSE00954.1 transposase [Streptomyces sp. NBC_01474]
MGGVSDAFIPAQMQVAGIRVEDVHPLQAPGDDVVRGRGIDQFAGGGLVQSEFPTDPRLRHPLLPQLVGSGMLFTEPSHNLQLRLRLDYLRFVGSVSWIMTHPEHLRDEDACKLRRLRERDPELDRLTGHVRKFAVMMTARHGDRLEDWITEVERDSLAPLARFAHNLRRDFDAVRNGLSMPHSSGAVEGNINRLKMLKRQMFGRASLDLLRKRVLLAR